MESGVNDRQYDDGNAAQGLDSSLSGSYYGNNGSPVDESGTFSDSLLNDYQGQSGNNAGGLYGFYSYLREQPRGVYRLVIENERIVSIEPY
ncbi:MAG: hypothetical protein Q4B96_02850 [Bacillota bacterium]|nr:hypothetical protein [Bacillota bacterium]